MKSYRPYTPMQSYLLPPSPTEWLPEGHLANFILDVVQRLDLRPIESVLQAKDPRGERSYAPRMMVGLLLYGYAVGVISSRQIARGTYEDVAFRVLAAGEHPAYTTVNQFRLDHLAAFRALFAQVLQLCRSAGLVKLGHVAIDGSKLKANASKHKAMSYERARQTDARLAREIEIVDEILARADAVDAEEDALYGIGQTAEDLPAELRRREDRRARIDELMTAMEAEAAKTRAAELREQAEALRAKAEDPEVPQSERRAATTMASQRDEQADELDDDDEPPPPATGLDLPRHQMSTTRAGRPAPKAQRNFTDPDSRIMVRDGAFVQAYNVQLAVDEEHQIIVAEAVTNQAPDAEHLIPMLHRVVVNCGAAPTWVTGDAGYFSDANVRAVEHYGSDPYIPGERRRRSKDPNAPAPTSTPMREYMRLKLATAEGKAIYARRKCTVEPVFGQLFSARKVRQFSLRGIVKAAAEWTLTCLTHNLRKLHRALRGGAPTRGALAA